jgi:hypothetical protein
MLSFVRRLTQDSLADALSFKVGFWMVDFQDLILFENGAALKFRGGGGNR